MRKEESSMRTRMRRRHQGKCKAKRNRESCEGMASSLPFSGGAHVRHRVFGQVVVESSTGSGVGIGRVCWVGMEVSQVAVGYSPKHLTPRIQILQPSSRMRRTTKPHKPRRALSARAHPTRRPRCLPIIHQIPASIALPSRIIRITILPGRRKVGSVLRRRGGHGRGQPPLMRLGLLLAQGPPHLRCRLRCLCLLLRHLARRKPTGLGRDKRRWRVRPSA